MMPKEVQTAFFPRTIGVGRLRLAPLTLEGAVRLEAAGVAIDAPITRETVFIAASILAGEESTQALRRARCGLSELIKAVSAILDDAFSTFIAPAKSEGGAVVVRLTPHGLGWALELAEWLCAEYGWPFDTAASMPVARAYALLAACRQRNGGRHGGLDYAERAYCETIKRGRGVAIPAGVDFGKGEAV